jgi:hypothetical protein
MRSLRLSVVQLFVGLSRMQREWYQKIMQRDVDAVNGEFASFCA